MSFEDALAELEQIVRALDLVTIFLLLAPMLLTFPSSRERGARRRPIENVQLRQPFGHKI